MKALIIGLLAAGLLCLWLGPALADRNNYVEGELLVKFKGTAGKPKRENVHAKAGSQRLKHFDFIDVEHIKLKQGMSVEDAIALYSADPDVEYAEPNHLRFAMATTPNDTSYGSQWGHAKVEGPLMWDTVTGDSSMVIAVLDSGINDSHADLSANIWQNPLDCDGNGIDNDLNGYIDDCQGWDFVEDNSLPDDVFNHGTKVAGIIGAIGNNNSGTAGMLWDVSLMNLRFINSSGSGDVAKEIEAITYAKNKGVKLMNASFGGAGYDDSEKSAINAFCTSGGIMVAAAGNSTVNVNMDDLSQNDRMYPAAYSLPCIISVASSDNSDNLSLTSYYGPISVDIAAPGESINSTNNSGGWVTDSGTSFSTPHVTGIAGLLWAARPAFTRDEIIKRVITASEFKTTLNGKVGSGGRANAYNTLLPVPANITATVLGDHDIQLTWDMVAGASSYRVFRRTEGSWDWYDLGTALSTTAADSALVAGTKYNYAVRAAFGPDTNKNLSAYNSTSATTTGAPAEPVEPDIACFIATAAYGNANAPEVRRLRDFRDSVLMYSAPGRILVSLYYRLSPPAAEFIQKHAAARMLTRAALRPVLFGVAHPGLFVLGLCSGGAFVVTYTIRARQRKRK